jgi:hypothetical protein
MPDRSSKIDIWRRRKLYSHKWDWLNCIWGNVAVCLLTIVLVSKRNISASSSDFATAILTFQFSSILFTEMRLCLWSPEWLGKRAICEIWRTSWQPKKRSWQPRKRRFIWIAVPERRICPAGTEPYYGLRQYDTGNQCVFQGEFKGPSPFCISKGNFWTYAFASYVTSNSPNRKLVSCPWEAVSSWKILAKQEKSSWETEHCNFS